MIRLSVGCFLDFVCVDMRIVGKLRLVKIIMRQ